MIKRIQLTTRKEKNVLGRRVTITSILETNIDNIWEKIQDVDTLREICSPKASFISCNDIPPIWKEGRIFVFKMYLHRIVPVGRHTINIIKMDKALREIVSNEYNQTVTIWNHYINMEEVTPNSVKYTDTIDLYAGWLTPIVAWWTDCRIL